MADTAPVPTVMRIFNECMKLERQQAIGAAPFERSDARRGQADAQARVRSRADVDGDEAEVRGAPAGRLQEAVDGGGDLASMDHPRFEKGLAEPAPVLEEGHAAAGARRLDAEHKHGDRLREV